MLLVLLTDLSWGGDKKEPSEVPGSCGILVKGQRLGRHFEVLAANAAIADARIILIGDRHAVGRPTAADLERSEHANNLINDVGQDGDWLLLEGRVYEPEHPQTRSPESTTDTIRRRLNFTGWENEELLRDTTIAFGRMIMQATRPGSNSAGVYERFLAEMDQFERLSIESRNRVLFSNASDLYRRVGKTNRIFITAGGAHVREEKIATELEQSGIPFVILLGSPKGVNRL